MTRIMAMFYGLASYTFSLLTFLYALLFVEGFVVPKTIDSGPAAPLGDALIVNILLLSLFAVQHSVMARAQFKRWWTQFVPPSIERSTYVLLSTLALALICWQWRPLTATVWSIDDPVIASAVVWLSLLGWLFALLSTFLISHFELFGLHQVFSNLTGRAMPVSRPGSQARKIFVFDSIVVVRNPGGTLSPANLPPRSSANGSSAGSGCRNYAQLH